MLIIYGLNCAPELCRFDTKTVNDAISILLIIHYRPKNYTKNSEKRFTIVSCSAIVLHCGSWRSRRKNFYRQKPYCTMNFICSLSLHRKIKRNAVWQPLVFLWKCIVFDNFFDNTQLNCEELFLSNLWISSQQNEFHGKSSSL